MKKIFLLVLSVIHVFVLQAQIPIGTWRDHLPYNKVIMVADAGSRVYAATPQTIYYVEKAENSMHRLSKIEGLSDVGISAIAYSETYKSLVIAYQNTNVDLLINDVVFNIPDIKRKIIPGKKTINNIEIKDEFAYLSCGFGIIVLDIKRKEINDTWLIGPLGNHLEVFDIAFFNHQIYAATELGLYFADASNPNLANYNFWQIDDRVFDFGTKLNMVIGFKNQLLVNKPFIYEGADSIFMLRDDIWEYAHFAGNTQKKSLFAKGEILLICGNYEINEYDTSFQNITHLWTYNPESIFANYAIIDKDGDRWIADNNYGLVKNSRSNFWASEIYRLNGPISDRVFQLSISDGKLLVAQGGVTAAWGSTYDRSDWSFFEDNMWSIVHTNSNPILDTIYDILVCVSNPLNKNQVFAASWGKGILEFQNGQLVEVYNSTNTPIPEVYNGNFIGGLCMDKHGNLWASNSNTGKILTVKTPQNNWYTYSLAPYAVGTNVSRIFIDSSSYKWIILPRSNGLIVFDDNGTLDIPSDDRKKSLNINLGTDVSTNQINCIAQDLDRSIWIGTDKGIKVFYNPENIFENNAPTPKNILIEQDGYVQNLLEFENVSCIVVDGANQKWIGTSKAGLFVMSPDGTREIFRFTESNSPLLSNAIIDVAIDNKTGEVFIATDKGIVSYRGYATMGGEIIADDVTIFPNPVRENYDGYIAINGLTRNANVKISDINGRLVYQTIAKGGQALWNGKNFAGEKV
ncbi:MAG: hypothetical protein RBS19_10095, partial [Bacteroidales bacterium]|nr:hypothetical protein [Bacteroidales bacterium]